MPIPVWLDSELFNWVILPLLIFLARITDVTLGTMRIIFLSRGKRNLAPVLGFFEVLIWIVVIGQLVRNLNNIACYVAYAAGFATGTYVGMKLEEKLALGLLAVRVIVVKGAQALVEHLVQAGYGVTRLSGTGATGAVDIIYTIIERKEMRHVVDLIREVNPQAFFLVEEVRSVNQGIFPHHETQSAWGIVKRK